MKPDQKFFVFDCESVGLHGQTFAVAGGIYDIHGKAVEGSEFAFHCDPADANAEFAGQREHEDRMWIQQNVTIREGSIDVGWPGGVRGKFWELWMMAKKGFPGILMFVECGWPVEARFLKACVADGEERNWEGPYPMHEVATLMLAAGMDPMATYDRLPEEQPAHEPLADARLSARLLSEAWKRLATTTVRVEGTLLPDDIQTMVGIKKWMQRLVDRMPELPAVFFDNTDPTPLVLKFRELVNRLRK